MSSFSPSIIIEGRRIPSPSPIRLFAGPLTLLLEPETGFVRQILAGSTVVLNGIYAAVRDQNWETVTPEIHDLRIDQSPASFLATFRAVCINDDLHFIWNGTITGSDAGRIEYAFDGEAVTDVRRNRIGFCVLHDARAAGSDCSVLHTDQTLDPDVFPRAIAPHQPFRSLHAITHAPGEGIVATVTFEGDEFEMEDQRNWTDASFKTYCTPLDRKIPVELSPGDRVRQRITLDVEITPALEAMPPEDAPVELSFQGTRPHRMPGLGLGMPSHQVPVDDVGVSRLRSLAPDHLRCDLKLFHRGWQSDLEKAENLAAQVATRLHLALFIDDRGEAQLSELVPLLARSAASTLMIFHKDEPCTSSRWLEVARRMFSGFNGSIFTGTDANFTELNRQRPQSGSPEGASWSINPQVHAFDNRSLLETLDIQWETAISAREFTEQELMISPVTLKPRWNPYATSAPAPVPIDELPPQVDPRQMSLFGSAWTLGSIASLSRAELLRTITYYETTGWRGLMETAAGPQLAHLFVSRPNMVFPLYFVFALIAGRPMVHPLNRSSGMREVSLMCSSEEQPGQVRLLVASCAQRGIQVQFPSGFTAQRQLTLDQDNAVHACRHPEEFLETGWESNSGDTASLSPFALLAVDGTLR